jgi:cysteine desulfurase/selenocysteine lyase
LLDYGTKRLLEIEGLKIFGTAKRKPVISFNIEGIHPYDIGTIIDKLGIAVRTGHCAQPIMTFRYSRNNTSFFSFTIPKKKSTLWLKR